MLTLRQIKPKPKEVPDPKRRNTNQHPQSAILNAAQEETDILPNDKPLAISAEDAITTAVDRAPKNDHLLKDSTAIYGERGVETRCSIDSDLDSEKKFSEREREIR